MRHARNLLTVILLTLSVCWGYSPVSAQSPVGAPEPTRSVVHILVFWTPDCHACRSVVTQVMHPLIKQYGDQIDTQYVDVVTEEDVERFYQVAAAYGIDQEAADLPMILIGEHALVGSEQIPAELPGLVEMYLANGGVALPDITQLVKADTEAEAMLPEHPDGYWLAIVVLAGMVAVLIFTVISMLRGLSSLPRIFSVRWLDIALPGLCLISLGVACYLAYVETQAVNAVCGPVGDCNAVQASSYARLFGVLPVGVLGVIGYLMILAAWAYQRLRRDRLADWARLAMFGMTMFGVLFSIYLTYLEPFVIKAVCMWCITSAVIMTILLMLTLKPALQAIRDFQEAARYHANIKVKKSSS